MSTKWCSGFFLFGLHLESLNTYIYISKKSLNIYIYIINCFISYIINEINLGEFWTIIHQIKGYNYTVVFTI